MKRLLFLITSSLFLISLTTEAQFWLPAGGRSAGMGSASVSLSDFWSSHNNQAGMAFYKKPAAGFYLENHFLLREMSYEAASATVPTRYGVFGLNLAYSGDKNYSILNSGLAYALAFGSRFAAGIQLDFLHARLAENYGSRFMPSFEAGLLAKINDQLSFGAHVFNPVQVKAEETNDGRVPAIMNAGFSYSFSDKLLLTTEVCKHSEFPVEFAAAAEYQFFQKGFVRLGLTTNPFRYTFGFGLRLDKLHTDVSSSVHEALGASPGASFYYEFAE